MNPDSGRSASRGRHALLGIVLIVLSAVLILAFRTAHPVASTIDLRIQPSMRELDVANDSSPYDLVRNVQKTNVTLLVADSEPICFIASETIVRREEQSNYAGMLAFHLPPMSLEDTVKRSRELALKLGMRQKGLSRLEQWSAVGGGHHAGNRVYLNNLEDRPFRTLAILKSYNPSKPWYIQIIFVWD